MRKLARASALVLVLTVLLKSVALLREAMISARFGADGSVDAFVAAFLPISIGANTVAAVASAFVPVYARRMMKGGDANMLVSELLGPMLTILAGATLVALALARPILSVFTSGYGAAAASLSLQLYFSMLPVLPLAGLAAARRTGVVDSRGRHRGYGPRDGS